MRKHHKQHTAQKESSGSRDMIITVAILMATTLGTTIPLYIHNSSQTTVQIEAIREDVKSIEKSMNNMHAEIRADMRDFHGRLISIEERNKR